MDNTWTSRWDLRFDESVMEDEFRGYHERSTVASIREGMLEAIPTWGLLHAAVAVFAFEHVGRLSLALAPLYPLIFATYLVARREPTRERCRRLQWMAMGGHLLSYAVAIGISQYVMAADVLTTGGLTMLNLYIGGFYRHRTPAVAALLLVSVPVYVAVLWTGPRLEPLAAAVAWGGPVIVALTAMQGVLMARAGEKWLRETFLKDKLIASQQAQIRVEQARAEELLLNVLPSSIATVLKQRPGVIADEQPEASVLFADLAGFTSMSSGMTASQVVEMLNEVFTEFDGLVDKYGLEKIKTIGDCYMVAAGVPEARPDHAAVIVQLALEMRDLVASREFAGRRLNFRFGVNSGAVVAGVIGRRKFIYDIWGDTVNVASRMESSGHAGVVQVSEATRGRIQGSFNCEPKGCVHMKGKGEMAVFHVTGAVPALAA